MIGKERETNKSRRNAANNSTGVMYCMGFLRHVLAMHWTALGYFGFDIMWVILRRGGALGEKKGGIGMRWLNGKNVATRGGAIEVRRRSARQHSRPGTPSFSGRYDVDTAEAVFSSRL